MQVATFYRIQFFGRFSDDDDVGPATTEAAFAQVSERHHEVFAERVAIFGEQDVDGRFDEAVLIYVVHDDELRRIIGLQEPLNALFSQTATVTCGNFRATMAGSSPSSRASWLPSSMTNPLLLRR